MTITTEDIVAVIHDHNEFGRRPAMLGAMQEIVKNPARWYPDNVPAWLTVEAVVAGGAYPIREQWKPTHCFFWSTKMGAPQHDRHIYVVLENGDCVERNGERILRTEEGDIWDNGGMLVHGAVLPLSDSDRELAWKISARDHAEFTLRAASVTWHKLQMNYRAYLATQ